MTIEAIEKAMSKTEIDRAVADTLIEGRLAYHQTVTEAQVKHTKFSVDVNKARNAAYDRLGLEPPSWATISVDDRTKR